MPKLNEKTADKPAKDERDELIALADQTIRTLGHAAREAIDGMLDQWRQRRDALRRESR